MNVVAVADLIGLGAAELVTGPFGTQLGAHEYVDVGTPVINVRNVGFGDVRASDLEFLDDATAARLSRHRLRKGDIVFGRKGAVERHAFISSGQDGWIQGSDCIRLRLDPDVMDPRFVSFVFRTEWHKRWMQNHCSSGATMASLNQDILRLIEIPSPSLVDQRLISAVLGAFDDLIEINSRRIAILEEMARLIYREWFVHFRFPGCEDVVLVDSDLGPIPEGWETKRLDEVASLVDGDWIETKDQGGSDYRLLQVSNIGFGSFRETGNYRYVTADTFRRLNCTEVAEGDVLVSRMPDPVGRAWYVDYLEEPAITAVDIAIIRPFERCDGRLIESFLNSPETIAHSEQVATGTTRKRVTRRVLSAYCLALAPLDLRRRFEQQTRPIGSRKRNLHRQNEVLRQARDLLLPRLISGELDVVAFDLDLEPVA